MDNTSSHLETVHIDLSKEEIVMKSPEFLIVSVSEKGKVTGAATYIIDETTFKEDKEMKDEEARNLNDMIEDIKNEINEHHENIKTNKYDRFIQNKKNKQQFKSQKFNPKVAAKFNGKNNMNLRRGGGR